jgi:hypothetical protein
MGLGHTYKLRKAFMEDSHPRLPAVGRVSRAIHGGQGPPWKKFHNISS